MREKNYEYAVYRINEVLKREDIENNNGVMSFFDMLELGKKGLKGLVEVTNPKSKLAKEINKSNFLNELVNNYYTMVETKRSFIDDTCKSTIKIISSITDSVITLTKSKETEKVCVEPYIGKNCSLTIRHLDTIKESFNTLEKYSNLFGDIDGSEFCYIQVYDSLFYVRLYYNDHGQVQTEIHLSHKYDTEQKFNNKKTLKEILEKNKDQLLKKLPIDLNRDLRKVGDNHILLLAQQEYNKEREKSRQLVKTRISK